MNKIFRVEKLSGESNSFIRQTMLCFQQTMSSYTKQKSNFVPSEIFTVTERHVTGGDEIDFFSLCRGSLVSFEVFFTSKNFITSSSLTKFV